MEFLLILRALRHNRVGASLIALQIALTLAIVCNSLSIIQEYIRHMRAPSGVDERNIIVVDNSWLGPPASRRALRLILTLCAPCRAWSVWWPRTEFLLVAAAGVGASA